MKILVVGSGLSGATIANVFAENGHSVTILEKRDHIAGNCYDFTNEIGILMNRYGPHLFHTNSEEVWSYVQKFAQWMPWKHKVLGCINGTYFPVPVNIGTVNILLKQELKDENDMKAWLSQNTVSYENGPQNSEEMALSRVGPQLYAQIFKDYTAKQWNKSPVELNSSVLSRIPVRTDFNDNYLSDKYQALPLHGYTAMVKNMITHKNIRLLLNTEYTHDMKNVYDYVFYTGPIDSYFSTQYEKLEYRSLRFEEETLEVDKFQPVGQVNYTSRTEKYTRIIEYKHFLNQKISNRTTIVKEYSCDSGEPYYPVPTERNALLYEKYQKLAQSEEKKRIFFVGRLATYKYYNMDEAILSALKLSKSILE